jgi:hypothetical protein
MNGSQLIAKQKPCKRHSNFCFPLCAFMMALTQISATKRAICVPTASAGRTSESSLYRNKQRALGSGVSSAFATACTRTRVLASDPRDRLLYQGARGPLRPPARAVRGQSAVLGDNRMTIVILQSQKCQLLSLHMDHLTDELDVRTITYLWRKVGRQRRPMR